MFNCHICDRAFASEKALRGHSRIHKSGLYNPPKFKRHICCISTKLEMHVRFFEKHLESLSTCQHCSVVFKPNDAKCNSFCSQSCAAKSNNRKRGPRSEITRQRISDGVRLHAGGTPRRLEQPRCREARIKKEPIEKIGRTVCLVNFKQCPICAKSFYDRPRMNRKTCSRECGNQSSSQKHVERIRDNGTTNFSTRVDGFSYKAITIDCDSKLEAAAIMYLVDEMGATSIERCRSILNYKDDAGKNRKFLPDFYVRIGDRRLMVEVKQIWKKSAGINNYNRFFDQKRASLESFCTAKGLEPLWLDFDYDPSFRAIYRKFINV